MEDAAQLSTLAGLLRQADQALSAAAAQKDSMASLPDEGLLEVAELAARLQRLTDALMVQVVHHVERQCLQADPARSLAARFGLRDSTMLLMVLTGAGRHTLAKYRRIAAATTARDGGSTGALPPLMPQLASALRAGAIGLDQALVVRDTLNQVGGRAHPDALEAAEVALVAAATGSPDPSLEEADDPDREEDHAVCRLPLAPELLAVQARAWRDAIDPDGPEPSYEQQRARRSFTLGQRADGMWVGKLLLPADQGAALRLALDAHNAPRSKVRHETDQTQPPIASNAGGQIGSSDDRSSAQRQADTLVGLVTRAAELAEAPRIGGDAPTLVVTITADQLTEHAATGGGIAHLQHSGDALPAHVAARIICDGLIQTCVLDEAGLPLKLGRARRSHTRHQRRAILTSYPGGCQNPGCEAPPGFTEIHHPIWWSDDGATDTDNGIPLCQHCHGEVHAGRLVCFREPSGRWAVAPRLSLQPRGRLRLAA
ncbi:HNH endonuclease signature motif containing protein [Pseudactinotalea suaedae]|uniref:HNH endonuclease signature motif containing protein n=1 Tax=Pseudactinotalea suaedae TaxID=1524924 RepID=UPI0012E2FE37|nr:HNH endonuclease signature motif containing protein [Pseudactinotalea suaedae]